MSKTKELQTECGGPSNFVASKGWLWRFKRDYIRSVNTDERTVEMDHAALEAFKRELPQILMKEDVLENNLYNMDETCLFWRALPPMTLEKQAQDKSVRSEKVTVGLCANATGSHKLLVLFVHKREYPRALHYHANLR
nr:PREDICTED: jerky protein homolog [Megachile rotundata]